jgi:hypothetical protein
MLLDQARLDTERDDMLNGPTTKTRFLLELHFPFVSFAGRENHAKAVEVHGIIISP